MKVLAVDDETAICALLKRLLESCGHEVAATTSAEEGIRLFLDDPGSFDLVVTDYAMPRLTGLELIERIKTVRPDVRTVLFSGHHGQDTVREAKKLKVDALLWKPLEVAVLLKTLQGLSPSVSG